MKIIKTIRQMQQWSKDCLKQGKSIGFVPTLGALHNGHISLVKKSKKQNKLTAVSIFVNPAQFGPREDLSKYPRPISVDKKLLEKENVDALFVPSVQEMYPANYSSFIEETDLSTVLCGASRPGHFRGVATIVSKFFTIINPHRAYFGEKDYQQLKIIQRLVRDFDFSVTIVPCPTIRESDGLALSSRNKYLTGDERKEALFIYNSLQKAGEMLKLCIPKARIYHIIRKNWNNKKDCKLEYFTCVNPETLKEIQVSEHLIRVMIAVRIGKTRLIDNTLVRKS